MEAPVAVIYYSVTGNVHGFAGAVAEEAEAAGADPASVMTAPP
jgi:flavodoxin